MYTYLHAHIYICIYMHIRLVNTRCVMVDLVQIILLLLLLGVRKAVRPPRTTYVLPTWSRVTPMTQCLQDNPGVGGLDPSPSVPLPASHPGNLQENVSGRSTALPAVLLTWGIPASQKFRTQCHNCKGAPSIRGHGAGMKPMSSLALSYLLPIACPVARERVLPPQDMHIPCTDMPTRFTVPIAGPVARERVLPPQHLRIRYSDVPTKSESKVPRSSDTE